MAVDARRERRTHGTQSFPFEIYPSAEYPQSDLVPCHWHPESEIIKIEEGEVGLIVGNTEYTGRKGDVYFVQSGELHEIRGGTSGEFHSFVYPLSFLQFARSDFAQSEYLLPLASGQLLIRTAATPEQCRLIGPVLDEIYAACRAQLPGFQILVKADLLRIIALAAEQNMTVPHADGRNDYRRETLRKIVTYLDVHYSEHLRLNELASLFGMTPQYFCTFFHGGTGRTLISHINFLRAEKASRLLRETDRQILDISITVGFENPGYFIRRFRQYFGVTPAAYRRQFRESRDE